MNDTPQGDGNKEYIINNCDSIEDIIRMNDTPQGDGNYFLAF